MPLKTMSILVLSLITTALGLMCGWYGAVKIAVPSAADDGHGASAAADDHAGAPAFSSSALKNLGVRVEEAVLTSFVRYQPVAAVVTAEPGFLQEVYTPVPGRIKSVSARFGSRVETGDVLVTLIRAPLPRVELTLTGEVLKPVNENLHDSIGNLRRATIAVEILTKELERLRGFSNGEDEIPVLPAKEIIKVEYELMQAERELAIVIDELEFHGLGADQIHEIERGKIPEVDATIWLEALKHNGYWTPLAQEIYATLPEETRETAWAVATIAELVAGDLANRSMLDWLRNESCAAGCFLQIGGLLQQGHNLENLRELCALGALAPLVEIRAPDSAPDWDVRDLLVKPGEYVAESEPLLILEDPRCLYLRAEPTDSETAMVIDAMTIHVEMEAHPLVPGTAPLLEELRVQKITSGDDGRTIAFIPVVNAPLSSHDCPEGRAFRSWELRLGQRYELRVPIEILDKVYILPAAAVVDEGIDKIVFRKSAEGFQKVPVEVLYQDHEVAVLPASSDIYPGNPIVSHGAFTLALALRSQGGADSGGAHAGHNH